MAEKTNNLDLDGLREEIRDRVKIFSEKVISAFGDNLQNITIVGSSLTEDFRPGQSDINTVLVLGRQSLDSLDTLARMARSMNKKGVAVPLLMTPEYIERSRDVFGIEFLDFQLTHKTIYGDDPFASLTIAKTDVRLQCERELKATLIRLRQGYIAAAANKRLVRDILVSAAGGLVPLLRAMLWLKDIDRGVLVEQVFIKAASEFSIKADSLIDAKKWRHKKSFFQISFQISKCTTVFESMRDIKKWRHKKATLQKSDVSSVFESIYANVEQLAFIVDKLEV
ncbi:hypothetical protein LCGC14_2518710 [marine sediment metagenome]|uniref:Polymerase nucleotidyl transferase domain-containing protein n=1 Tax=marine sediment metagenome TaxID=412755 RepID=A0A0F9AX32_9ZZZZ